MITAKGNVLISSTATWDKMTRVGPEFSEG